MPKPRAGIPVSLLSWLSAKPPGSPPEASSASGPDGEPHLHPPTWKELEISSVAGTAWKWAGCGGTECYRTGRVGTLFVGTQIQGGLVQACWISESLRTVGDRKSIQTRSRNK